MNRSLVVSVFGGLVLVMWLAAWSAVGSAERFPDLLTGEPGGGSLAGAATGPA